MSESAQRYDIPPSDQSPADQGLPPDAVRPRPGYDQKYYEYVKTIDPLTGEVRYIPIGRSKDVPQPPRGGQHVPGGLGSVNPANDPEGWQSNPELPYHPVYNPGGYRPQITPPHTEPVQFPNWVHPRDLPIYFPRNPVIFP